MIAWSNSKLRMTSGIGALCTVALLAEITHHEMPIWLAMAMSLLPLVIFLFVQAGEMQHSVVSRFQGFASLWYLGLAATLTVVYFSRGEMVRGWPVYFVGLSIGCIPCVIVLWRLSRPDR